MFNDGFILIQDEYILLDMLFHECIVVSVYEYDLQLA